MARGELEPRRHLVDVLAARRPAGSPPVDPRRLSLALHELVQRLRDGRRVDGDISTGQDAIGFSLAGWMVIVMAVCMAGYWFLRKRVERWQA